MLPSAGVLSGRPEVPSRAGIRGSILCGLAILLFANGTDARAQAAAEYAGAVAAMGTVGTGAKSPALEELESVVVFTPTTRANQRNAPAAAAHMSAATQIAGEDDNRKTLEEAAGPDAGKLLLRSKPTKASVWISGKRIGNTPLLLILSPGAYRVELRGDRLETAEQRVDLQPRESREVVVTLEPRYPSIVRLK